MKKNISVLTNDKYLYQKIYLELSEGYEVFPVELKDSDITVIDIDTYHAARDGALTMSRYSPADISIPFPIGALFSKLSTGDEKIFYLNREKRSAVLHGEKIKLTDVEFSLLSVIFEAGGEFISREEILKRVWNDEADGGVINVYVHYLREKLEKGGEKIIISSRKGGYRLNEKLLGGELC